MESSILHLIANQGLLPVGSLTWLEPVGRLLIALAGLLALASFIGAIRGSQTVAVRCLHAASISFCAAFLTLLSLFLTSQFQFRYVQRHSAYDHELQYKFAGVWAGQEGSFLLWAICSALCLSLCIRRAEGYQTWFAGTGSLFLAALAGILSFESPFVLNPAGTDLRDGFGMMPSLLNYWIVIHPPTIFLGFGSLTALFAWAVAAMLHRNLDSWIGQIRPWAMISLTLTGVGLCMGGFWAYETLGWGGFWAWDPVENTSLVPWLLLCCLVHGILVQKAKNKWHLANIVYAALPFLSFCYGTFLTRSGFLGDTSNHSFAKMDRSALWILMGLGLIAIVGFLGIYFSTQKWWKSNNPAEPNQDGFWTKETFYAYGNWMFIMTAVIAGFGMSVPLVQSLKGQQPRVVEEPLYNTLSTAPFLVVMIFMAIGPFLSWRRQGFREVTKKFINILSAAIATAGFLLLWFKWGGSDVAFGNLIIGFPGRSADPGKTTTIALGAFKVATTGWVIFLIGVCAFATYANLVKAWQQLKKHKLAAAGVMTHVGVALTIAGLIVSRGLEQKSEGLIVHESKTVEAFGYQMRLKDRTSGFGDRNNKILIDFTKDGRTFTASPGLYFIPGQDGAPQEFLWPYIQSWPLYDLYIVARAFNIEPGNVPDFGGSEPVRVLPGQAAEFNGTVITYQGMKTEGNAGMTGAKFIAVLTIEAPGETKVVNPYVQIKGPGQLDRPVVDIGRGMGIYVDSINAADKSASLVIKYLTPAYPLEIYYKPLTILVWWGVGIMGLGGLLAAYYRRIDRRKDSQSPDRSTPDESNQGETRQENATQELTEV